VPLGYTFNGFRMTQPPVTQGTWSSVRSQTATTTLVVPTPCHKLLLQETSTGEEVQTQHTNLFFFSRTSLFLIVSSANCSGVILLFLEEDAGEPRELVGELMRLLVLRVGWGEVVGLTGPVLPVAVDPRSAADSKLVDRLDPDPAKSSKQDHKVD
jgi:hypothetical protein